MKPIMMFYRAVLDFIQSDTEFADAIKKIIALAERASPSWEATTESLAFLEKCSNRGGTEVEDEDLLYSTLNNFVKAAFRDLSPLRDLGAMDLFMEVANEVSPTFYNGDDIIIWARTVKERPDGSGVLVLHVTDLKRYRELTEDHNNVDSSTKENSLEYGVLIGS